MQRVGGCQTLSACPFCRKFFKAPLCIVFSPLVNINVFIEALHNMNDTLNSVMKVIRSRRGLVVQARHCELGLEFAEVWEEVCVRLECGCSRSRFIEMQ